MAPNAETVVRELLEADPSLRPLEGEVRGAVAAMLAVRPETGFREEFRAELRRELETRMAELSRPAPLSRFWPVFTGVAFAAFAGLVVVRPMLVGENVSVPEPSPELRDISFAADYVSVSRAGEGTVRSVRMAKSANVEVPPEDLDVTESGSASEKYSRRGISSPAALSSDGGSGEPSAPAGASLMVLSAVADSAPSPRYAYGGRLPAWSGALAEVFIPYARGGSGITSEFRGLPAYGESGEPAGLPAGVSAEESAAPALSADEVIGAAERGGEPGLPIGKMPAGSAPLPVLGTPSPCWLVASGEDGWTLLPALAFPAPDGKTVVVPLARAAAR